MHSLAFHTNTDDLARLHHRLRRSDGDQALAVGERGVDDLLVPHRLHHGDLCAERSSLAFATRDLHMMRAHRSEEHTSELQSHSDLVCRLLLEKKKKKKDR